MFLSEMLLQAGLSAPLYSFDMANHLPLWEENRRVKGGQYSPTNCRESLCHLRSAAKQMRPTPCAHRWRLFLFGNHSQHFWGRWHDPFLTLDSLEPLLIIPASGVCLPGGLPGVLNGTINYARCVWVHHGEGGVPLLLFLLLGLGLI